MNKRIQKKKIKLHNKYLCKRYPFLIPHDWDDKPMWKSKYSYTELDEMEPGWRKAFGEEMCEELREELLKYNSLSSFRIVQIKEKFGGLRFYVTNVPPKSDIYDIIHKYENLSYEICTECGQPAHQYSDGWIYTLCDKCIKKIKRNYSYV